MNPFFEKFAEMLDIYIIGLVILSGFFQKKYFKGFCLSKDGAYDSALKTLGLSAIVSGIYILLVKDPNVATPYAKYFLSYFAATSLYELLINPFVKWIQKKTGSDDTIDKP